jgi:hypothetical protein
MLICQIVNTDGFGMPNMHRRAMHIGEPRGDLNGANGVCRLHRAHRDDQLAVKPPGRSGVDISDIGGDTFAMLNMLERHAAQQQSLFE